MERQSHDEQQAAEALGMVDMSVLNAEAARFEVGEHGFNGLITNDKFCLSRPGRLVLSWWRYPLRRRDQEQAQRGAVPDTDGDRGGAHAAPMAGPPPDAAGRRTGRAGGIGPTCWS